MRDHAGFDATANLILRAVAVALFVLVAAVVAVHLVASAVAHEHDWFARLRHPLGFPCCDGTDCRALDDHDARIFGGGWQVRVGGEWHPVPTDRVLKVPNELGRPTLCAAGPYPSTGGGPSRIHVYCFVPAILT